MLSDVGPVGVPPGELGPSCTNSSWLPGGQVPNPSPPLRPAPTWQDDINIIAKFVSEGMDKMLGADMIIGVRHLAALGGWQRSNEKFIDSCDDSLTSLLPGERSAETR
jgi:hypothetical protein